MKKFKNYDIIKRPLMTEKSTAMSEKNDGQIYTFEVSLTAEKPAIKEAVENIFEVKVESINTVIVRGKMKRVGKNTGKKSNFKKAYVTLKEGQKINLFEGNVI